MNTQIARGIALLTLAWLPALASAAAVSCGSAQLGVRLTEVEPGKEGGLCYAQNGNMDPDFTVVGGISTFTVADNAAPNLSPFPSVVLSLIGKNNESATDALVSYTGGGALSGDWTIASSAWTTWTRLFVGFHFGGGGDTTASNPDSFIVELNPVDLSGAWELTGPGGVAYVADKVKVQGKDKDNDVKLNGLSNFYVFGSGTTIPCERTNSCGGGGTPSGNNGNGGGTPANGNGSGTAVPEPTSLALVGLALLGLGIARRRRA